MPNRTTCRALFQLAASFLLVLLTACGGHSGSPAPAPVVAPSALIYATNPAVYTLGQAVLQNAPSHGGGSVNAYTVTPALPAGLALNGTSGAISGTPTVISASASYTVTATNSAGSTTANLAITVNDAAPSSLVYTAGTTAYTKGVAIIPNAPSHGGGVVISYSVSPSLPAGLSLNPTTGVIDGTPTAITASATYTVTATNSGGSATATLTLTVNDLPPTGLTYAFPAITATVGTAIADNAPSHGGGAVSQYTVSPALPAGLDLNFSTGLLSGTPTAPALAATYTITAANGAGSTAFALSITVNPAVVGKTWFSATTLSLDQPGDASTPQIAFGGSGLATAVWEQYQGTTYTVWGRRFTPGSGWSAAQRLDLATTESAFGARVAMDAGGNALVVWLQRDDTNYWIWANRFALGSGWSGAVQLDSGGLGSSTDLRLALDAAGHGVAAWIQKGASTWSIKAAQFRPASGWGVAGELMANAMSLDLALDSGGAGMLVASAPDVAASSVWGIPFDTSSGWGTAALLESDDTGGWDVAASVAMDPAGRAMAVWQRYNSVVGRFDIRANRFTPGSGWATPEVIETNDLGSARDPRVALDANGNGIAVWDQEGSGGRIAIWGNRYIPGSGWGAATLVEAAWRASDNFPAQSPQIAFDSTGNAFSIWQDFGGDIEGAAYTLATGWGPARGMGMGTVEAPGGPQIAFDSSGNAFAIWHQMATPPSGPRVNAIWVSRYE